MPKPTDSYIANMIVRYVLTDIGKSFDYEVFTKTKNWINRLSYFANECCYCGKDGEKNKLEVDHIIGMNINELGLDCFGNIAPSCKSCNQIKNKKRMATSQYGWEIHLKEVCDNNKIYKKRRKIILDYMRKHSYPPPSLIINTNNFDIIRKEIYRVYEKNKENCKDQSKKMKKYLRRKNIV